MKVGTAIALAAALATWTIDVVKFASCDFAPDYKCEVLHGVGIFVPPASFITAWTGTDQES